MKFFNTIESIRSRSLESSDPFIVQWEIPVPRDDRERMYIVFNGISEYQKYLESNRYTTCHEVFLSSTCNPSDDIMGHPAFDIDLKLPDGETSLSDEDLLLKLGIPDEWKEQFQEDLLNTLCKQYPRVQDEIRRVHGRNQWVWMSSKSSKKLSKHLVLSSITFSLWRVQMKILLQDLLSLDRPYIKGIDDGIYRKLGSLRLPLNHKRHPVKKLDTKDNLDKVIITGSAPILTFDDPSHSFLDGIVAIHDDNMYTMKNSLLLSLSDLAPQYRENTDYTPPSSGYTLQREESDVDESFLLGAFSFLDKNWNTGLVPGKVSGNYLTLIRKSPGICPLSGREHEGDNAYIYSSGGKAFFGCHRNCSLSLPDLGQKKVIDITPYQVGAKAMGESSHQLALLYAKRNGSL